MIAVQADQESGTGKFLGNPTGHNANHALVPAFIRKNNGFRGPSGGEHGYRLTVNFRFHSLPLAVQFAQLTGHILGFGRIFRQEQIQRQINLAHAACGVDPGRQNKADGGRIDGIRGAAAFLHQCGNTGAAGMGQSFQAPGDKYPVFSLQGHHIRYGAQADHVGILRQYRFLVAAQSGSQFEGHAYAGQILVRIAAVDSVRVYHCHSLRQGVLALVVIGNDQIYAKLPAKLGFLHGSNAAVYRDDQLDTGSVELFNGDGVQTVAFFQSTGDVADAVCTVAAQKVCQQAGGGNAVHIVVAENRNFFSLGHGKSHSPGGQIHIGHQKGVQKGRIAI